METHETSAFFSKKISNRSSRMRNVNSKISDLSLGSTTTVNFNSELSSKADNNGGGIVYHRSDCSYPQVNIYGAGGRWNGLGCGYWLSHAQIWSTEINVGGVGDKSDDGGYQPTMQDVSYSQLDVIWYGDAEKFSLNKTAKNKYYGTLGSDHNWTFDEIRNIAKDFFI